MTIDTWQAYQQAAIATAIYPQTMGVAYPALGLANEAGEVCGKLKKWFRDGGELPRDGLIAELGDVAWYVVVLARDAGIDLEKMRGAPLHHLYMSANESMLPALCSSLAYEAAKVSMVALSTGNVHVEGLRSVAYDLWRIASVLGVTLGEVCQRNFEKLASRAERGTLRGSGDER